MATLLLLELLVALTVAASTKNFHIVPLDHTALCHNYSSGTCFTLDHLSSQISETGDITLSFLPGEHLLTWNMKFNGARNVTLKNEHLDKNPRISCLPGKHIKVTRTKQFTLQGLIMHGCKTEQSGGVILAVDSNVSILNCRFINNTAGGNGGALSLQRCITIINGSIFRHNHGQYGGALIAGRGKGTTNIRSTIFEHNHAHCQGGAIYIQESALESYKNNYTNNAADVGGAVWLSFPIDFAGNNTSNNNSAWHGDTPSIQNSTLKSNYTNNTTDVRGAVSNWLSSPTDFANDNNNSAWHRGTLSMKKLGFKKKGLKLWLLVPTIFENDIFSGNIANHGGAAIFSHLRKIQIKNCHFARNVGLHNSNEYCGVVVSLNGEMSFTGSKNKFSKNSITPFVSYDCDVNFEGCTIFSNNTSIEKGGAVISMSSILNFWQGSNTVIRGNTAKFGGGMYLEHSIVQVSGEMSITGNTGEIAGGGLYAFQTDILVQKRGLPQKSRLAISNNIAKKDGGGIYLSGASCEINFGHVFLSENGANRYGGAVFMEQSSKIVLIKSKSFLNISHNSAQKGGGIYIVDNKAICGKEKEENTESFMCSIQTNRYSLFYHGATHNKHYQASIFFDNNNAEQNGIDIYGGLLDRCNINPEAEILLHYSQYNNYNGVRYLLAMANFNWKTQKKFIFHKPDTLIYRDLYNHISSDPIRLCFCENNNINCTSHKTVFKKKGVTFTLSIVAVDQVGKPVNATLISSLKTENGEIGRLKEGQQTRHIEAQCTELEYNVYASGNETILVLHVDGPCEDQGISRKEVNISFQPCTCPIGLSQHPSAIDCSCNCDKRIAQYISNCSSENGEIQIISNVWINYVASTNITPSGFAIQQCPFDYCKKRPVDISLISERKIDQQCASNRAGRLCGQCAPGLSLVFASSRCQQCSNYYLFFILPFVLAGIALVAFILLLNMTVAGGTIYGLIFYVNILAANRPIFLPFEAPNFLTVFVSWLNLDLGIEICFYNGMDSYGKFLLQLVFPAYMFLLIAIIMVLCNHSQRIANLLGKKNPEATLYTLILLSYSKLIRIIITALQFEFIKYPGTTKIIWLYDANILYFAPSHIPRFLIAFIVTILGAVYTTLLLFGQLFNRCSGHRLMKWTTHRYYIHFLRTHHASLSDKHRYWVGLLLLVRLVHYLISAFANDSVVILSIGVLTSLLLAQKLLNRQIYSKQLLDNLDSSCLLNITILSISTLYITHAYSRDVGKSHQQTLAIVSMSVSFIAFLGIVLYHVLDTCGVKVGELPNKLHIKLREHQCYQPVAIRGGNQSDAENYSPLQDTAQGYNSIDSTSTNRSILSVYDQLREPALDDLIPVRPEDYNIPPAHQPQ